MADSARLSPVYILLPPDLLLLDVTGPAEVFYFANRYQQQRRFELHFVAAQSPVTSAIGLPLLASALPETLPPDSLLLIPGVAGHEPDWQHLAMQQLLAWLTRVGQQPELLVTICAGSLIAAKAGLLAGHSCTTHHSHSGQLAALSPAARVLENRLFVQDGRLWSSAGVTSGIDLALSLLERLTSAQCAAQVARNMVVFVRRNGAESQFSPWLAWRNHLHPAVHRVQDAISQEPEQGWTLEQLAAIACVTPRHLTRIFREQTGITLTHYQNELRLALASSLLQQQGMTLEQVAERVGLGDAHQLRRVWHRHRTGTPSAWRQQTSRQQNDERIAD